MEVRDEVDGWGVGMNVWVGEDGDRGGSGS